MKREMKAQHQSLGAADVTMTREALRRRSTYDWSFIVVWSVIIATSCGFWGAMLWLVIRH